MRIVRPADDRTFPDLVLVGTLAAYAHPFLGILPMRDDPKLGVAVRYVYPGSPTLGHGQRA